MCTRLTPLLDEFDRSCERLAGRLAGPVMDSGDGSRTPVAAMTDDEYLWQPVPDCWSVRRRTDGPGTRRPSWPAPATGAGTPHPAPPPFTTLAWRLSHFSEMLLLRADHTTGTHTVPGHRVVGQPGSTAHHGAEIALLRDLYRERRR